MYLRVQGAVGLPLPITLNVVDPLKCIRVHTLAPDIIGDGDRVRNGHGDIFHSHGGVIVTVNGELHGYLVVSRRGVIHVFPSEMPTDIMDGIRHELLGASKNDLLPVDIFPNPRGYILGYIAQG